MRTVGRTSRMGGENMKFSSRVRKISMQTQKSKNIQRFHEDCEALKYLLKNAKKITQGEKNGTM